MRLGGPRLPCIAANKEPASGAQPGAMANIHRFLCPDALPNGRFAQQQQDCNDVKLHLLLEDWHGKIVVGDGYVDVIACAIALLIGMAFCECNRQSRRHKDQEPCNHSCAVWTLH
jgi:hypothetical protein